jgi:integrase
MAKIDLSTVRERDRLRPKSNRTPYWHRIEPGCFVGYRPTTTGAAGVWSAQAYVDGKTRERALGSFGAFPAAERFAKAKAAAEDFFKAEKAGGRADTKIVTVADACRKYAETHASAEQMYRLSVWNDPIAKVRLDKLRRQNLVEWRERLETRSSVRGGQRAPSSVNREMVPLRAALRQVLALGAPNTEAAWQEAIKPFPKKITVRRRTLYLDRKERQALLANISAEAEPFVRALCLLPVRPGALAKLTVRDFAKKTRELTIPAGIDKGHGWRRLDVGFTAVAQLTAQTKTKLPLALLFAQADGQPWDKDSWKRPIRAAALAAGLDPSTSAYTLRHSVITDLVAGGVPTLTVAQLAGTSVTMIEEHYGHLLQDVARKALESLAL